MKSEKTAHITLLNEVKKQLQQGINKAVFPGAAAGIVYGIGKERRKGITWYGKAALLPEKRTLLKNNYFDLASLTKPLATTLAILCLLNDKKIKLDEKLSSLFGRQIKGEKSNVTVRHLLSHSSGFPAHREYFKKIKDIKKNKKEFIENLILQEKLDNKPGEKAVYSDLGFILLGRIIEIKSGQRLEKYVEKIVLAPLDLEKEIFFNRLPLRKKNHKKKEFVATEDCPWRKKVLCGEVHDDNCYVMGGVAGHSGLFGNISAVTDYAGIIIDMWKGVKKHPNIKTEDLELFLSADNKNTGSSWALGFDRPATKGASCGSYFSEKSVGHLGFTGTSFWIDPEKDIAIVLLTNRVHPSRENAQIKQFRPHFYDRVMEKLLPLL